MAQTTRFIKFEETAGSVEYIYPIDNIQSVYASTNALTTIVVSPGKNGVGQALSRDSIAIVTAAGSSTAVADKILDDMISACCGGKGSPMTKVTEDDTGITSITVTVGT